MEDLFNMEIPDFDSLYSDLPDLLGNECGITSDVYQTGELEQPSTNMNIILEDLEKIPFDNIVELPLDTGPPDSPFDQDFTELLSEGVSSPASITSGSSYTTDTYSSPASEAGDAYIRDLSKLLVATSAPTSPWGTVEESTPCVPESIFNTDSFEASESKSENVEKTVSSPGSITSGSSYTTDTYSAAASEADDAYIRDLLELLVATSATTSPLGTVEESTPCVPDSISNIDHFKASESKSENVETTAAVEMTTNTGAVFSGEHGKARSTVAKRKSAGVVGNGPLTKHCKTLPGADKKVTNRIKNNAASKQARVTRKQKEEELFLKAEKLERSNAKLKDQILALTNEIEYTRKILMQRLGSSN